MRHPQTVLAAYRNGDRIEDDELERLRADMRQLADLCSLYGEMFNLSFAYAERVQHECGQFLAARRRRVA